MTLGSNGGEKRGSLVVTKAPNSVIVICVTVVVCSVIGAVTALSYAGSDTTELSRLINTLFNVVSVIFSGGAFLYSGAAAKRADDSANSVNGELHKKIESSVRQALMKNENVKRTERQGWKGTDV